MKTRRILRVMTGCVGAVAAGLGLVGCEELGGGLSPRTLAEIQAGTRRLTAIDSDLKGKGLTLRTAAPAGDVVQVPMRMKNGLPFIQVGVGAAGSKSLLFDTGATMSVLGAKEALDGGAYFVDSRDVKQIMARGVFGTEAFLPALVPKWSVGDWSVGTMPVLVPAERAVHSPGSSLKIMGFYAPKVQCSYVTVNYLTEEVIFGFRQAYRPSGYSRVRSSPMSVDSGVPMSRLSVGGVSWDAILDTGSFNGIEINEGVAQAMGRARDGTGVSGLRLGGVGGMKSAEEVGLRYIQVASLNACGMVHRNAQVDIAPGPPRVGSFFFQDYKVTFDIRNRKLWLEW